VLWRTEYVLRLRWADVCTRAILHLLVVFGMLVMYGCFNVGGNLPVSAGIVDAVPAILPVFAAAAIAAAAAAAAAVTAALAAVATLAALAAAIFPASASALHLRTKRRLVGGWTRCVPVSRRRSRKLPQRRGERCFVGRHPSIRFLDQCDRCLDRCDRRGKRGHLEVVRWHSVGLLQLGPW
jgi:hypothetical protein